MEDRLRHVEFKRLSREAVAQGGDRTAPSLGALKVEGIRLRALEPCQSPAHGQRSPLECPQPQVEGEAVFGGRLLGYMRGRDPFA